MKLNLACGNCKLEGYLNVDIDPDLKPDQVVNVCGYLPFENEQFEEVLLFHAIEHIEKKYHAPIFAEIHRILQPNGLFLLGYPEFSVCAKYWLDNYLGKRDFWEACIYGRQLSDYDYHVCAINSTAILDLLRDIGFKNFNCRPEDANPQYTLLKAVKGTPRKTYEEWIKDNIFGSEQSGNPRTRTD